jgi:hypothetical protein
MHVRRPFFPAKMAPRDKADLGITDAARSERNLPGYQTLEDNAQQAWHNKHIYNSQKLANNSSLGWRTIEKGPTRKWARMPQEKQNERQIDNNHC